MQELQKFFSDKIVMITSFYMLTVILGILSIEHLNSTLPCVFITSLGFQYYQSAKVDMCVSRLLNRLSVHGCTVLLPFRSKSIIASLPLLSQRLIYHGFLYSTLLLQDNSLNYSRMSWTKFRLEITRWREFCHRKIES